MRRIHLQRALLPLLLAIVSLGSVRADEPGRAPAVVVLEYRSNVPGLPGLAEKVTQALTSNTSLRIIDLRQARQRRPRLDAEVARCAGDATCLGSIGVDLQAEEVLLVALSQLGDVVLAMQRIDVARQKVAARVADSVPQGQAVDEVRVMGWLQQLYPPQTFKRYGQIRVTTDVSGAQVYVNAQARGKTPLAQPISVLAPGSYRLLLEKDRYLPFQASVSVMPDTTVEVSASLAPQAVATPWYKRWYVWAAVGAGALAAVGSVAIYYAASREPPDMTRVPAVLDIK